MIDGLVDFGGPPRLGRSGDPPLAERHPARPTRLRMIGGVAVVLLIVVLVLQ